VIRFIS